MRNPLRITVSFLGLYAGLIGIQHGIFEILQGKTAPGSLMFSAIGAPCQPETVWHACFPAMSLIPNLLVTGVAAVMVGVLLLLWALFFTRHRRDGLILGLLASLLLLVGGGFVPVWIGLTAAFASCGLHRPVSWSWFAFLAKAWPWLLAWMALWLLGSWLLGTLFPEAMLAGSGFLFLVFDILLPVLAALSGLAHTER